MRITNERDRNFWSRSAAVTPRIEIHGGNGRAYYFRWSGTERIPFVIFQSLPSHVLGTTRGGERENHKTKTGRNNGNARPTLRGTLRADGERRRDVRRRGASARFVGTLGEPRAQGWPQSNSVGFRRRRSVAASESAKHGSWEFAFRGTG